MSHDHNRVFTKAALPCWRLDSHATAEHQRDCAAGKEQAHTPPLTAASSSNEADAQVLGVLQS